MNRDSSEPLVSSLETSRELEDIEELKVVPEELVSLPIIEIL